MLIRNSKQTYFSNWLVMDIVVKHSCFVDFVVNSYFGTGLRYYASNDCLLLCSAALDHHASTRSLSSSSLARHSSLLTLLLHHNASHKEHPLTHQNS